jgi:hypothetical protein
MKEYTQEDLDILEENIKEMSNEDTTLPNICLEDLEKILTTFFERKIKL